MIFYDSKIDISHRLFITLGEKKNYHILIAAVKKMLVQQGLYMVFCGTLM